MTLLRNGVAGESINLRARVLDDEGDPSEASGLFTYIFVPSELTGEELDDWLHDINNAAEILIPEYWEQGIFEITYEIPDRSPVGIWYDLWVAELSGQTISGLFSFEVLPAGEFDDLTTQLNQNNWVDVYLYSGLLATDGQALEEDYSFSFLTEITPAYTDELKVRIETGSAIAGLQSDTIYLAILEASLEADMITFVKTAQNTEFYQHARREWATCKAASILLTNSFGGTSLLTKSKSLGDFSVTYDTSLANDLLNRIAACLQRWEPQLNTGGYKRQLPQAFIKGELDEDRPIVARLWRGPQDPHQPWIARQIPASNVKNVADYHRRWKKGFVGRWG